MPLAWHCKFPCATIKPSVAKMSKSESVALLGIRDQWRSTQLNTVKDKGEGMWSRGLVNHPDFTLHGIQHSETIIRTIANLMEALRNTVVFNDTERFLIGASAYLHDIGMLIDLDGFIEERLDEMPSIQGLRPDEQRRVLLIDFSRSYGEEKYIQEFFDKENPVEPREMRDAALIREIHHLFSDFLINKFKDHFNISEGHEYLFVAPISRGHRRSDLSSKEYDTANLNGEPVKTGVLAAFLRIADELDYSSKRIPDIHFEMYGRRLLREPVSLEHWIKHFYVTSPGAVTKCSREDTGGLITPVFEICATVPHKDFKELLRRHIKKSRGVIDSPSLRKRLKEVGVAFPKIDDTRTVVRPHAKRIPGRIGSEIKSQGLWDFLRELKGVQVLSYMSAPTMSVLDNPPEPEQIARVIGYQRNDVELVYDWFTEETCKVSFTYEIEALERIAFFTSIFWNEEPLNPIGKCKIRSLTPGYDVRCKPTVRSGGRKRVYGVRISPPLGEHGKPIQYVISENFRDLFALTGEDLKRKLKLRPAGTPAGMEAIFASIVIPVARLIVRVIFPPHYKIKNGQCKVTMIDSSIRCGEEEKRVKSGRFFKSKLRKKDDRLALQLDVIEPRLLRTYALIWSPMES